MQFKVPDGTPRYALESFFGESVAEPNKSLPVHPQEILRSADVIIGEDVMTQHQFLIFGRDHLEHIVKTGASIPTKFVVVTLDQETDDLEKLIALVQVTFGKDDYPGRPSESEMVRFYDFETQKVFAMPKSELAPGSVRAKVEGIEGEVWIQGDKIITDRPEPRHPPFNKPMKDQIRRIKNIFAEHRKLSLKEWEDGFRCDMNPDREIAVWLRAADTYSAFAGAENDARRRFEIYRCLTNCMLASPDAVWRVYKPEFIEHQEAQRVINHFYGQKWAQD